MGAIITKIENATSVLIAEKDPYQFLEYFWKCIETGTPVFIGNPYWKQSDWNFIQELLNPDIILGGSAPISRSVCKKIHFEKHSIFIPTGGSSGKIRFVRHTWDTLRYPTQAILNFFNTTKLNSCCMLPLYHISGLIQVIRTHESGGALSIVDWKEIEQGILPEKNYRGFHISLVPTQLTRLLNNPQTTEWLHQFNAIFLGGAPADIELLSKAKDLGLRLAPTYGLSETAAMVAAQHPDKFLSGNFGPGQILSHARIKIDKNDKIWIKSNSLFKGYFPESKTKFIDGYFCTNDLGLMAANELQRVSRADDIIITGGKKVNPREIESLIIKSNSVLNAIVYGKTHKEWGQELVVIYTTKNQRPIDEAPLKLELKKNLEGYKVPKKWIWTDTLPIDEKGKLDRAQMELLIE